MFAVLRLLVTVLCLSLAVRGRDAEDIEGIIRTVRKELKGIKEELKISKIEQKETNCQLLKTREKLENTIEELKTLQKLYTEVSLWKDPPYTFACGSIDETSISAQTITYSSLLFS